MAKCHVALDTKIYDGGNQNASVTADWAFGSQGIPHKSWSDQYVIIGDEGEILTEEDILSADGLPILGQPLRDAWCTSHNVTCEDDSANKWMVRCEYNSDVSQRVKESTEERYPTTFPGVYYPVRLDFIRAILKWSSVTVQQPLLHEMQPSDAKGLMLDDFGNPAPVMNTVGEPLYPQTERNITVLDADYFLIQEAPDPQAVPPYDGQWLDWNWIEEFSNTLNSDLFFGAPKGCALCSKVTATETGIIPYYDGMAGFDSRGILADPTVPTWVQSGLNAALVAQSPARFIHVKAQFKFRYWYHYSCSDQIMMIDKYEQGHKLRILNQGTYMMTKNPADEAKAEKVGAHWRDKAPVRVNLALDGFPLNDDEAYVWLDANQYRLSRFDVLFPYWVRLPLGKTNEEDNIPEIPAPAPCT